MKDNRRDFIHLVYSSAAEINGVRNSKMQTPDEKWEQFELFASNKPDAMIFAQPEHLGLDGIVQIVAVGHARRIIDLREMPFISFGNETRESFLKVLITNQIEYFNIFNLRHKLGRNEACITDDEEKYFSFEQNEAIRVFKPMIETGPTVVFSDCVPSEDKAVQELLDLLSLANIPYSPIYADNV